ncbi:MAG TPA: ABC transporter ATP-binding protein [Opitutae bacterium]|nr:ABC transporter ATP-binding protein [Opitutae bacterium]HAF59018.1 ABC transporter ATP-binding protein [Opitutae bacterium]|tara:strand:- start:2138 stop:3895 length:1758 start_codon:yes stop_codon:yes gene_type:complete
MCQTKKNKVISRVSSYLFFHKALFVTTLLIACTMTVLSVLAPSVIQQVLDKVLLNGIGDGEILIQGILFIAAIFFFKELLNCLRIRINNKLEQKVIFRLRQDLHNKLLHLPINFYDRRKSGDISSRVIEDVQSVERAILDGTEQGVVAVLTLVGVSIMMFWQEPRLAALVFLPLPILSWMAIQYARISKKNWRAVRDKSGELNSLLVEDIQGNRLIHSFGLMEREKNRFTKIAKSLESLSLKAMYRWSIQGPGASFTSSLGILGVVGMGAYLLESDPNFTTGQFFAFLLYTNMFYEPIRQLVGINNLVAAGKASGERVFEVLDAPIEIKDSLHPSLFPLENHTINFSQVSFSYAQRSPVVEGLSFSLPHGSTTALVGPTGAGKSTVANLLLRYYNLDNGSISIGGIPIDHIPLNTLRANIGLVSQDPFLFDTTVRENLLLADEGATEEDIISALQSAHARDFVEGLPDGLDTHIGERGVRLSMGEKQRLTLARAMLKSSPILILDEATASVDVETERKIQQALQHLIKDRTTLIIAHRLSTIREADTIIFLENGKIIEQGSHQKLIGQQGAYANFCQLQENIATV